MKTRPATIRTLARKSGVSVATVSRFYADPSLVSEEVGRRIRAMALKIGYEKSPVGRKPRLTRRALGFLLVKRMRPKVVSDPVLEEVRDRLGVLVQGAGYEMVALEFLEGEGAPVDEAFFRKRVLFEGLRGVFLYGDWAPTGIPAYCAKRLLPAVHLNRDLAGEHCVHLDQEQIGHLATSRLLALGHPRVGLLMPEDAAGLGDARRRGWLRAHREMGRAPGAQWRIPTAGVRQGYEGMKRLLKVGPPAETAIFCNNDATAFGALRALHEAGIAVPEDVSLVGSDDLELAAHTVPALSTVRQDFQKLCAAAMGVMRDVLGNPGAAPQRRRLPAEFIERESSAPPHRP